MKQPGWIIITGEYPPQSGGVSDYTHQLARRLVEAGDEVEVFAPFCHEAAEEEVSPVRVHRLADHFGPHGLWRLSRELNRRPGRRVLVQYVPHAYGYKAMNVLFARWVARRARRDAVWIMFHEVAYPYEAGQKWRHRLLAGATHWMARQISRRAARLFMTTPVWEPLIQAGVPGEVKVDWLPVPSNLPEAVDGRQVEEIRNRLMPGRQCIGHFGTYGRMIRAQLETILPRLLKDNAASAALLIGRGSEAFAQWLLREHADLQGRISATGGLSPQAAAAHVAACHVMVQPYPDGVTCRRGSLMAALALGKAIVTSDGAGTEAFWRQWGALALTPVDRPERMVSEVHRLLNCPEARSQLERQARRAYTQRFAMEHTVEVLRGRAAWNPADLSLPPTAAAAEVRP